MKSGKGITLIALVITIIVLLILAAVSIAILLGENGILTIANESAEETNYGAAEEKVKLAVLGSYDSAGIMSDELIIEELYKMKEMTSLKDKDNIDIVKDTINLTDKYPIKTVVDGYEFEIAKSGQVTGNKNSTGNTGGTINPPGDNTFGNGSWDGNVNSPNLGSGMTAVAWNDFNEEIIPTTNEDWYEYKDTEIAGVNTSKWANAQTSDGSYWVWIPRYEYKLDESAKTIDINFIEISQTTPTSGYKIHPAFENGSDTNYTNGEWDKELAGIWVMKYEASNSEGKAKSVPGVRAWTELTIGEIYSQSLTYDSTKESHFIKNSEWGAVSYLAYSQYGRNRIEITGSNNGNTMYTGGGGDSAYKTNVNQTTTGNITGIYDLVGNVWEYVAAYIPNGESKVLPNGSPMITTDTSGENLDGYLTYSTKYVTAYPYSSRNDYSSNYNVYEVAKNNIEEYGYGDAILETTASGSGSTSWYSDFSYYPGYSASFFLRGGNYIDGAGLFSFTHAAGQAGAAFRLVLAF